MNAKSENFFKNIKAICDNADAQPIVMFARGKLAQREALITMAGPVLTLDSLAKLRIDIQECLGEKEKQLQGKSGPDAAIINY